MNDNEIKVSQLAEAEELNENDIFMIVQAGVNKKLQGRKIGGNEIVISTTEEDITSKTKLFINSLTSEAKYKDGSDWISLAGDEVIIGTESDITDNTKILIEEVPEGSNIPYINSEIAIGPTNPNNKPTWFKKGKNLFSSKLELGTYSNEGVKSGSTTNYRNSTPIAVQPNTTYTFSINGVSQKYGIYYYNNTYTFISSEGLTTGTFTTPANCYYINFRCFNADFTSDYANLKLQIELGNTATAYEPYITPRININGENLFYTNDYSTTEQVVGKWINGKPVYRKVITINKADITAQTVSVAHGISNIGVVVRKDFIWERSNIQFRDLPAVYFGGNNWGGQMYLTATEITFELGTTLQEQINQNALYCYVIIEYTKTTD